METNFDCIVIGAGPAGLSAALNLRQRGKTVLVVHSGETLLAKAEQVDNYLGMPGLSGKQMMERFTQHARDAGAVLRKGRAGNVMPFGGRFMVNLDGDILETGAVVLACGVSKAKPVPGEAELQGKGCGLNAARDATTYEGKSVYVIGGADGLDKHLKAEGELMLRLSSLTLPHAMVRVLILEQIYRSWSLLHNHPYHRA